MILLNRLLVICTLGVALAGRSLSAQESAPPPPPAAISSPPRPTIFIAGDSTAQVGEPNAVGWGKVFGDYFDPAKVAIANRSIGGRSSRTFVTEGRWDRLAAELKAGDVVLIQFGQNDGADKNGPRIARGSLPGLGEETEEIDNVVTKTHETLHTFGWYERKMIADTLAKGARPILLSLTVRNLWKDGRVERGAGRYGAWARELAAAQEVDFIDLTKITADRYERMDRDAVNALFPRDHVHTDEDGARLNAYLVVSGLKGLREQSFIRWLSFPGQLVPTAAPDDVFVPTQPPPRGAAPAVFAAWLNQPEPADPKLPTVYLIGDSTVRNGRGNGYDGQFGWGDPLEKYFYPGKANLVNRAVGGTGARTFLAQWRKLVPTLKAGDVVIMQFGHNDNGARGALDGIGEETAERTNPATKEAETVHTFGWYLRGYIADIRAKGATPVICSLVPRNAWNKAPVLPPGPAGSNRAGIATGADGKMAPPDRHAEYARAVAAAEHVAFLDLNGLLTQRYNELGQEKVTALFADKTTHTTWAGAEITAQVVNDSLRALKPDPVGAFLRPNM